MAEKPSNFRKNRIFRRLNAFVLVSGSAKTFFFLIMNRISVENLEKVEKYTEKNKDRNKNHPTVQG